MFSLMGNCFSCIQRRKADKKPLTLAILGLNNAGKTTITKGFSGEPIDPDVAPTVGFSFEKFSFDGYEITLYDLGGGKKIRGIWRNYLHEIYGLIYVVDSSAEEELEEAQETLKQVLENSLVSGKPLLLLANKQDKEKALNEVDICQQLNLDKIVDSNKCPCSIETCSAIKGAGKKMDASIKTGMKWLLSAIEKDYKNLKNKVDNDIKVEEERRKIEKEERKKRVEEKRRERELKEEEERKRLGIKDEVDDDNKDEMINGDPFKKLDANDLKKKDEKLKEEKRKKKELLQKLHDEGKLADNRNNNDIEAISPRNNNFTETISPRTTVQSLGGLHNASHLSQTNSFSSPRSSANPLLPPLEKTSLANKFSEEQQSKRRKKKKSKLEETLDETTQESFGLKSLQTLSKIEVTEKSLESSRSHLSHDSSVNTSRLGDIMDDETPSENGSIRKKVVKKKKKKKPVYVLSDSDENDKDKENESFPRTKAPPPFIQVVPPSISENFEDNATPPSSYRRKKKNRFLKKRAEMSDGDSTPKHSIQSVREYQNSPKSILEEQSDEEYKENKSHMKHTGLLASNKWGLVDDLPQVNEDPRRRTVDDELL